MHGVDLRGARQVADDLLWDCYGVDVRKALDPMNQKDLLVIQRRLSKAVQGAAAGAEGRALRAALNKLDVDWPAMSAAQRASVLSAAKAAAKSTAVAASKKVETVLVQRGGKIVSGAKAAAAKAVGAQGFIKPSLNAIDQRILRTVAFNQAAFVRDEFGQRADDMINIHARSIVASGVKRGVGREVMMAELRDKLGKFATARSDNYWRTVGNYMTQTARSYGALSTYQEAGFAQYQIVAVRDKKTTPQCRMLDGKVYEIKQAITNIENATPDAPLPWLYEGGKDANGNREMYYKDSSGARQSVATTSAAGKFSNEMPTTDLQNAGIDTPPFHGNCRTTIKAVT